MKFKKSSIQKIRETEVSTKGKSFATLLSHSDHHDKHCGMCRRIFSTNKTRLSFSIKPVYVNHVIGRIFISE